MADIGKNTKIGSFKIDLDVSDMDVAQAKAERLKATLEEIKKLQAEIGAAGQGAV